MKKILLFSHDPGGANALIPLVKALRDRGHVVKLFGKTVSLERYKKFGLRGDPLERYIKMAKVENLKNFLEKEKIDCVITGTSHFDFTERYLWKASQMLKIPSFAVLDNWMNYAIRFSKDNRRDKEKLSKKKKLVYYPNKIFIMDAFSKAQAIKEGVDSSKLVITGQPYFELIKKIKKEPQKKNDNLIITYASQPFSGFLKKKNDFLYSRGYDEKSVFLNVLEAMGEISSRYHLGKKLILIVKIHPRENPNSYRSLVKISKRYDFKMKFDKDSNSIDLILNSDLVLGMTSMLLIEAVILKKPIICVQIGLKGKSDFVLAQKGILKPVLTKRTLVKELKNILLKNRVKRYNMSVVKNPTKNVIREVEKYL